jgi:hypothetical protein
VNRAKNIVASIRARLKSISRESGRPFAEILQYYSMERFLYRLSLSQHSKCFILKGALMLRVWESSEIRPTMDIDMLGITSNYEQSLLKQIRDVLKVKVEPDGLTFDERSLKTEQITEDADYQGTRIRFRGALGTARIGMQIDFGFGDELFPGPEQLKFPPILDLPAPILLCYTRESAIAEKFEAMIKLGALNSRMKDFYDIWLLSRQFEFSGTSLLEAVKKTFSRRNTVVPETIDAFDEEFANKKQTQWNAFRKKLKQEHIPESFLEVINGLKDFLEPLLIALARKGSYDKRWHVSGFWG